MNERRGLVLLRVAGGVLVRVSGVPGRVGVVRVAHPAPTTLAPGDQVTLTGVGAQVRIEGARRD